MENVPLLFLAASAETRRNATVVIHHVSAINIPAAQGQDGREGSRQTLNLAPHRNREEDDEQVANRDIVYACFALGGGLSPQSTCTRTKNMPLSPAAKSSIRGLAGQRRCPVTFIIYAHILYIREYVAEVPGAVSVLHNHPGRTSQRPETRGTC